MAAATCELNGTSTRIPHSHAFHTPLLVFASLGSPRSANAIVVLRRRVSSYACVLACMRARARRHAAGFIVSLNASSSASASSPTRRGRLIHLQTLGRLGCCRFFCGTRSRVLKGAECVCVCAREGVFCACVCCGIDFRSAAVLQAQNSFDCNARVSCVLVCVVSVSYHIILCLPPPQNER